MKIATRFILSSFILLAGLSSCKLNKVDNPTDFRHQFPQILDIAYTPTPTEKCKGWFTDAGSWMGFTLPEKGQWINGFCGPFSLDMNRRQWMAKSAVVVNLGDETSRSFIPDSTCYFPGELYMKSSDSSRNIEQRLHFINASTALLSIETDKPYKLSFNGEEWAEDMSIQVEQNAVIGRHPSGEIILLTFSPNYVLTTTEHN